MDTPTDAPADGFGPLPPPVLRELVEAARLLPAHRRSGPFRGRGDDGGLTLTVGRRAVFVSDEDAADLLAGDYIDVRGEGGDAAVTILPRAFAACGGGRVI